MISVLIPVYNFNVVALVTQIHKQLLLCDVPFEILCLDDASTSKSVLENENISKLDFTNYLKSNENLGRTNARQYLSEKAKYDWLLFLDADVIPKSEFFIENYLNYINQDHDAIYGGFAYYKQRPDPKYMLRWKYGSTHEQKEAQERNKKPYKVIISANFMIKKTVFTEINTHIEQKGYGFDNFFAAILKMKQIKVLHIDNEVYHLGIESSLTYLKKKEKAAETLLKLYNLGKIKSHQNDLLKLYIQLKRYKLRSLFSLIYKVFRTKFEHHLTGHNPSMKVLQLYRICFMCYLELN